MSESSPAGRGGSILHHILGLVGGVLLPLAMLGCLVLGAPGRERPQATLAPPKLSSAEPQLPTPVPATPTVPPLLSGQGGGARGKIAFVSFTDVSASSSAIMVVDPASGEVSQLTAQGGRYFHLTWLPGGETLAYTWGDSTSSSDLFVQRIDGQGRPHKLTNGQMYVRGLSLSPDGTQYALEMGISSGSVLYRADADGRDLQEVTKNWSRAASWSPDGSQIVFMTEVYHEGYLALLRMDGQSSPVRLNGAGEKPEQPAWSPTGEWIAYVSPIDGMTSDVCLIHPDGTGQHCLTNSQTEVYEFVWSPDGTRIAFSGGWHGRNIWVVNVNDREMTQLTDSTYADIEPNWSPDGTQIAFSSTLDDNNRDDIYVINADGSGLTRLTTGPAVDVYPVWSR